MTPALLTSACRGPCHVAANAATNRHDFLVSLEHALKHKDATHRQAVEAEAAKDEPELRVIKPAESG